MTKSEFPFADFNQILQNYKVPGVDMEQFIAAHQKNIQAITDANKVAAEGMQKIFQHQANLLQQTMAEFQNSGAPMTSTKSNQEQADALKQAFEKALGNMREMAEMATASQTEAFKIVQKRYEDSLADLKKMTPTKTN